MKWINTEGFRGISDPSTIGVQTRTPSIKYRTLIVFSCTRYIVDCYQNYFPLFDVNICAGYTMLIEMHSTWIKSFSIREGSRTCGHCFVSRICFVPLIFRSLFDIYLNIVYVWNHFEIFQEIVVEAMWTEYCIRMTVFNNCFKQLYVTG